MSATIGLNINVFLRNLIKSVGVCVFMIVLSWRMTILTFMGLPIVFAVSKLYGNYYKVGSCGLVFISSFKFCDKNSNVHYF